MISKICDYEHLMWRNNVILTRLMIIPDCVFILHQLCSSLQKISKAYQLWISSMKNITRIGIAFVLIEVVVSV